MFNLSQEENPDFPKRRQKAKEPTGSSWDRSQRKETSFNKYPGHPTVAWGVFLMTVGVIVAFISAITATDPSFLATVVIFSGGLFSLGSFLVLAGLLYRIANAVEALKKD